MRVFTSVSLIFLISLGLVLCPLAKAELKDEDLDAMDDEDSLDNEDAAPMEPRVVEETEDDPDAPKSLASPHAKATVLFVQPETSGDIPAGRLVKMLVGFHNNGSQDFIVDSIDGSFRYPQDFTYHIQNFSTFSYNKVVESEKEATFEYMFTPSETFSSRQFGLIINLRYRNQDGKHFVNTIFNETVSVVEPDEGIDGETFFLYVFLAALVVLGLVAAQQFFQVFTKKSRRSGGGSSKASSYISSLKKVPSGSAVNAGSGSENHDIDYEWIPKQHLQSKTSPKTSPRQRRGVNGLPVSGNSSNDE